MPWSSEWTLWQQSRGRHGAGLAAVTTAQFILSEPSVQPRQGAYTCTFPASVSTGKSACLLCLSGPNWTKTEPLDETWEGGGVCFY